MTVPAENISNTVLRRALPLVTPTDPWPMYIVDADQIEVWVEFTPGDVVKQLPVTYNIQINPTSYWEFVFTWTTPPGPVGGTQLIIFRRTRGVVNQFPPGSFLTAEALNLRFDLDNLSINDTAYYQTKTNPSYSKQTIASHGVFDPIPATDSNPALNQDDLDLPYLGTGAPAPDEVDISSTPPLLFVLLYSSP